ncbi:hypothetical protein [Nostoc sp. C052]|uniref:hypothetical protein n=1 Tax=Nostoc sp. C052 TaxID=2576902 RepID=UPI0015C2D3EE|nr:hypothetical protein [Nostoc sp. C052]
MALRKAERIVSPRSQSLDWECIPRGSASGQFTGGRASQNRFPAWRLGTSQSKGCILI